jgi:hypothetical protein
MSASFKEWRRALLLSIPLCLALTGTAVASASAASSPAPAAGTSPSRQIALGVHLPNVPRDMWRVDRFARKVGRQPAIIHYWQLWGMQWRYFDRGANEAIRARGATPMVSWDPWADRINDRRFALRKIIQGKFDRYVRRWATGAARWGHPIYIRFAAEMNGDWRGWDRHHNGNTPAQYVKAWRRIVRIFRKAGATNVKWVWSPNALHAGATPLRKLYPGNAYVDWLGFSAYNWGSSRGYESWQPMIGLYRRTVQALHRLAPSKPIMVSETGSDYRGGDKAQWIRDGFSRLPSKLPQVRALVWFNQKLSIGGRRFADWRVDQTRATLSAYRSVVSRWIYQGAVK